MSGARSSTGDVRYLDELGVGVGQRVSSGGQSSTSSAGGSKKKRMAAVRLDGASPGSCATDSAGKEAFKVCEVAATLVKDDGKPHTMNLCV